MKICTECHQDKELIEFSNHKEGKDGLCAKCKLCRGIQKANWQKANPQRAAINSKKWRKSHPEMLPAARASTRRWKKTNLDKVNAFSAKHRATKLSRTPKWLTKEQLAEIQEFYTLAKELQWLSEEPLHVDHIIPLQGENVSGLHVPDNLQIIPAGLNLSKGNKFKLS